MKNINVGSEYYTYNIDITSKGNRLRDYTGIMKVKCISKEKINYHPYIYCRFEILESNPLSPTLAHNIHIYMPRFPEGMFFTDKEACIKEHDRELIRLAKNQTTSDRERILSKVVNKNSLPDKDVLEVKALKWYNNLTKEEKEFVKWIKYKYDFIE